MSDLYYWLLCPLNVYITFSVCCRAGLVIQPVRKWSVGHSDKQHIISEPCPWVNLIGDGCLAGSNLVHFCPNHSINVWWCLTPLSIIFQLHRSVLLVEETGRHGENHRPVASHWQTFSLSYNVEIRTDNISGDRPREHVQVYYTLLWTCFLQILHTTNGMIELTITNQVMQLADWRRCKNLVPDLSSYKAARHIHSFSQVDYLWPWRVVQNK